MARTDRMAHHQFTMLAGQHGEYHLSVADVGDDYWNMPGPCAEAVVLSPGSDAWDCVWRGPHDQAGFVFLLLKEALKGKIRPDRWIAVQGGKLLYE
jgi:hypothetical protein